MAAKPIERFVVIDGYQIRGGTPEEITQMEDDIRHGRIYRITGPLIMSPVRRPRLLQRVWQWLRNR